MGPGELEQLVGIFKLYALYAAEGIATDWSLAATEIGDLRNSTSSGPAASEALWCTAPMSH
jgi:hypothetical protein